MNTRNRIVSFILSAIMAFSALPAAALAETTLAVDGITEESEQGVASGGTEAAELDDLWEFRVTDSGAELTAYNGDATDVYIPSMITAADGTELPVLKLADNLFEDNDALNSATLGAGILEIGDRAFYDCDNLVCVLIAEETTTIGAEAFYSCDSFNSIILYDAVTTIGANAFAGCPNVTIWCNEGTAGYSYAKENDINCKSLGGSTQPLTVTVDGLTYYINKGEAAVTGCDSSLTNVIIPSVINGVPVTTLNSAFYMCRNLQSVTLPETLKSISGFCFQFCSSLTSIDIPDGVTSIGQYAFNGCDVLTTVSLPDGLKTISHKLFYGCDALLPFELPSSLTYIDTNAFDGCYNYSFDTLPEGVTYIGEYAFARTSVNKVYIHENVSFVGQYAFYDTDLTEANICGDSLNISGNAFASCSSLKNVVIGSGVTGIGYAAFSGCSALTSVTIDESVTSFGENIFSRCSSLKTFDIPEAMTTIPKGTFEECNLLNSVTIPDTVTEICESAFAGCFALEILKVPKSVSVIDEYSFSPVSLISFEVGSPAYSFAVENNIPCYLDDGEVTPERVVDDNNIVYYIVNGEAMAFKCQTATSYVTGDYVLPDEVNGCPVTGIYGTFSGCYFVDSVKLPAKLETIGAYAFQDCSDLVELDIPDTVTYIGEYAFRGSGLTTFEIPENVTYIGRYAFAGTDMDSVVIPESVDIIREYTFSQCSDLKNIILHDGIKTIEKYAFYYCTALQEITIPESVTVLDEGVFYGCSSLLDINIPESITDIRDYAFNGCSSLKNVIIPDSVTYLGGSVFSSCPSLETAVIGNGVTAIPAFAFNSCSSLTSVTLPDGCISIGERAFQNCNALSKLTIPVSVTSITTNAIPTTVVLIVDEDSYAHTFAIRNNYLYYINDGTDPDFCTIDGIRYCIIDGEVAAISFNNSAKNIVIPETVNGYPVVSIQGAFKNCSSLTSVVLPEGLKNIGDNAFYGCSSLTEISIPETVTSIGNNAFNKTGIVNLVIPDSVTNIGEYAFAYCEKLVSVELSSNCSEISDFMFCNCIKLKSVEIPDGVVKIGYSAFFQNLSLETVIIPETLTYVDYQAFYDCVKLRQLYMPQSVKNMTPGGNASSIIYLVYEGSDAHNLAVNWNALYFVLRETANPEIAYGTGITGTVTYSDGTVASGATVDILYDDGTLKESVTADENGTYEFTYAEVGRYTVRASDGNGNTASTKLSVKRMNVFSVFLAGDTAITLKKSYTVSGTVSASPAEITLTDTDGHIIAETASDDGKFTFSNVPNGTYIIKAETENGSASQEITVFDGDLTDIVLEIIPATSTVFGYVEIEKRDGTTDPRNWVNVSIYNGEGTLIDTVKSDDNGRYSFENLILGEYSIVAVTEEMRPDKEYGYERIHTFTGYGYIYIATPGEYELDTIVLREESDAAGAVSGKVTANGETQDCEVVLCDSFRREIARYVTKKNGKYTFVNVCDGYYYITATTKSDGMGWTTVVVKDGEVYGDTDIRVAKSDTVQSREDRFLYDVPELSSVNDAEGYRSRIAEEKRFYDGLSDKEKKQLSEDYLIRLNQYAEALAVCEYTSDGGVIAEQGGLVISDDEIENGDNVSFTINVNKTEAPEENTTGVESAEDFVQDAINDAAGERDIVQYYEITMTKTNDGAEKAITSVYKDTDAMGKFRITMSIPEEYRGYRNYSIIHNHHGEIVTLTDLDDDPDTITIEIDRFSTFALAATDNELVLEEDDVEVSEDFKIKSANLILTEDISVIYKASIPEGYTDHYMVFNYHGEDTTVYGTANEQGTYSFRFDGVLPQCMGDNIKATLYATVDGKTVSVSVDEYSVRKYCENQLAKTTDTKFITLMSDLLTLGAASQEYISYNCDSLVTDGLALTPSTFTVLDESANKEKISGTKDEGLEWRSAGLIYNNAMAMFVRFSAADTEGLQIQLTVEDRVSIYDVSELAKNENGYYTVILTDILATEYDSTVTGVFLRDGVQTGETLTYSVNSYVYMAQNSEDAALAKIVQATYNYGRSACVYVEDN